MAICSMSRVKSALIVLSVLRSLLAIVLIWISAHELKVYSPGSLEHIGIVLNIVVGSVMMLSSLLGYSTASNITLKLLLGFIECVILLIAALLLLLILALVADYVTGARIHFLNVWQTRVDIDTNILYWEQEYSCCGKEGPQDYAAIGNVYPLSCYKGLMRAPVQLFTEGCTNAIESHVTDYITKELIIKSLMFIMEFFTLFSSVQLFSNIAKLSPNDPTLLKLKSLVN